VRKREKRVKSCGATIFRLFSWMRRNNQETKAGNMTQMVVVDNHVGEGY